MTRQTLEKYQVLAYLAAIGGGLGIGALLPGRLGILEAMLRPCLALLLYATFAQTPLAQARQSFADIRFITAAVIGNFLIIPIAVWGLLRLLPDDPAIRLGVLLVLLVPCTDWFITFAHLGGGDTRHAIAFTPISLFLQMASLPFYLWLFLGETFTIAVARQEMIAAFAALIALPLAGAFITEKWAERTPRGGALLDRLAWLPVPLLALTVFIIAATQANPALASFGILGQLLLVFVAFLIVAGPLAWAMTHLFRLPVAQGRVLAFSFGTRNSFVTLPLALALPPSYKSAVVAIVFQSLVELVGMAVYLWWVPTRLFPQPSEGAASEGEMKNGE